MHCTCGHWVLSLAPPLLCPCVQAPACHRRRGACIRGQAQGISCFPNESLAPKNVSGQSAAPKGVWLGQPPAAWPCTVLHAAPRYNPQNVSDPQVWAPQPHPTGYSCTAMTALLQLVPELDTFCCIAVGPAPTRLLCRGCCESAARCTALQ